MTTEFDVYGTDVITRTKRRVAADLALTSELWSRDHGLKTQLHSEFILFRSRSRDLKTQVSILVSRPDGQGLGL